MNRFFALPLIFVLMLTADDCGDLFSTMAIPTSDMTKSSDKGVQAAGLADEQAGDYVKAVDDSKEALSKANLAKGGQMSFDKINNAIKLQPADSSYLFKKAAMQVAAGQDSRQTEGMAFTALRRYNSINTSNEEKFYRLYYSLSLRDVSLGLPPGPERDRVNKILCPEILIARLDGDKSYEGVAC